MEGSLKEKKIQAMKNYRRVEFVYKFVFYSFTSVITCFFFTYLQWFSSMNHFLSSLPKNISYFLNAKCLFLVGNLIIFILVGESKLKQLLSPSLLSSSSSSSSSSPPSPLNIYDECVARSRSSNQKVNSKKMNNGLKKKRLNIEERIYVEEKKNEVRLCKSSMPHDEEKKKGLRSCKSEVWDQSEIRENIRGQKEKNFYKNASMIHEEKKMGMRSCKSEIWGESEIVKNKGQQLSMTREDLNKRVEAFISRVNKQRLLEAKLVDHNRG